MAEYIGSRISLISKRDIRYVGTLHEISSENSTVALEQVVSFGTEDRNTNPGEFVPPADNVYEYIVFRGSDVKDLRIEKEPEKKPTQQPQVPDDPAILGNARPAGRPAAKTSQSSQSDQNGPPRQPQDQSSQAPQPPNRPQDQQGPPPRFGQPPQYPFNYPNPRFGPQGPHGFSPYGHPVMPYGPPPGWFPPPGHAFPPGPPNQFYPPPNMPPGPHGPQTGPPRPPSQPATPAEIMASQPPPQRAGDSEKQTATVKLPSSSNTPAPGSSTQTGPPPPTESKPDVVAALAPPAPVANSIPAAGRSQPTVSKSGRIMPAVPIANNSQKSKALNGETQTVGENVVPRYAAVAGQIPTKSHDDANRDARAAVAAAMAKLPPTQGNPKKLANADTRAIDNLTNKVNEMRADENIRISKQPGTGGYAAGNRGGRGAYRGGRPRTESQNKKIDVPKTEFDFGAANAKFNKKDLAKEATGPGSPADSSTLNGETGESSPTDGSRRESASGNTPIPGLGYNKTTSFFDDISSESKDRDDPASKKLGGREFRSEEQKKNFETFGQGSVDSGHRGGYRGRGRGRGYRGGRSRGGTRGRGTVAAEG